MKPVVKFNNVSKRYSLFKKKSDQLLDIFSVKKSRKSFSALSNISFEVYEGEVIGVIGTNGSGKSTLSNLLAQVAPPTTGDVQIQGEPTLVAISAGLNNHLSGLENIELKCLMHGLNKKEIAEVTPAIIDFADIGEFIHQPIKNYSSGMKSRLGFAISVHINPDILVVDEALSVGDSTFHQKCVDKFSEFKEQGKTIFFISHSLSQVKTITDRIIWMNYGSIEMFDDKDKVAKEYNEFIKWFNQLSKKEQKEYKNSKLKQQMSQQAFESDPVQRTQKNKKSSLMTFAQIAALLLFFIMSTLLMFIDRPVDALIGNTTSAINEKSEPVIEGEEESVREQSIYEEGYIVSKEVKVYSDTELTKEVDQLPFTTEVFVEKKIGEQYLISYKSSNGYVSEETVETSTPNFEQQVSLENFTTVFPNAFATSYEYFFAFMNADYDEVKSTFNGLTDERENEIGQTVLVYDSENMAFKFNEEGVSEEIEVNNIDVNDSSIEDLISSAVLSSKDESLHYLQTNKHNVLLNLNQEKLTFSLK
ncbi:ATP-binding cassette domain-containing protein [Halobacillus yeomjeoni]|uniref:ATP-binding cassette domain-containing protein n=1 Tax=Halobacillus yeomjeoni TaxID=311194 RepID=A0A931HVU0_9BACI|nr:ATP-binding cassette domain-containing protein [Halobacillus yeomjeoni]MBH0230735.1 ATP-binding cassette domain-containing protein [Halobacillus yeomjeoni]